MKKIIILILVIGCLTFCYKKIDLYTGTLSGVDYILSKGWGSAEAWTLTFEDGQIYTIHKQPLKGFKIGKLYTVYRNRDKHLRIKEVK